MKEDQRHCSRGNGTHGERERVAGGKGGREAYEEERKSVDPFIEFVTEFAQLLDPLPSHQLPQRHVHFAGVHLRMRDRERTSVREQAVGRPQIKRGEPAENFV